MWLGASGKHHIRSNNVVLLKEKHPFKGRNRINGIEGFWSLAKFGFSIIVIFLWLIFIFI